MFISALCVEYSQFKLCVNGTFWVKQTRCVFTSMTFFLNAQSVKLPWEICSSKHGREEWHEGEFSFQFSRLSRTTWDRNNKVLRDWSQAKIMPPGQEVCQIPCMTFILLPSTPSWKDTQSLCPGALNCHKQLGYIHYYREPHANIRLGSFLESVQHVRARLIQWEDCGKRISYAVILCNRKPHQNYLPPVDELS